MINLIIELIIGALAGFVATKLMNKDSSNLILNCVLV